MPEAPSTRLSLVGPLGSELVSDGDDIIRDLIDQLEAVGAAFLQGTSRPAAAAALEGYFYVHTGTGVVSYCTGSAWIDIHGIPGPGYEIGYHFIDSGVEVSATSLPGNNVIISMTHDFDGGPVMLEFFSPLVQLPAIGGACIFWLYEGASNLGRVAEVGGPSSGGGMRLAIPVHSALRFTPSAGSHTYGITATVTTDPATVFAGTGAFSYVPAFARFTKV